MRNYLAAVIIAAVTLPALQGCAVPGSSALSPETATIIPAADPTLDHYIAWVPMELAQTAAVARAVTHISLGNARERTGQQLCAGSRLMNGRVAALTGPLPATAPPHAGGYPAWYYRISQAPGLQGCTATGEARLYRFLQGQLPYWISIQPAATAAVEPLTLRE